MNHLGDNFVDKHRSRPKCDIQRKYLYVLDVLYSDLQKLLKSFVVLQINKGKHQDARRLLSIYQF